MSTFREVNNFFELSIQITGDDKDRFIPHIPESNIVVKHNRPYVLAMGIHTKPGGERTLKDYQITFMDAITFPYLELLGVDKMRTTLIEIGQLILDGYLSSLGVSYNELFFDENGEDNFVLAHKTSNDIKFVMRPLKRGDVITDVMFEFTFKHFS